MIHITLKDYKSKYLLVADLVEGLRNENKQLKNENAINIARLGDAKNLHEFDSDQIHELKLKVEDLQARLENEKMDLRALRDLYDKKCYDCERFHEELKTAKRELCNIISEKERIEEKLKTYELDDYVCIPDEYYHKLRADEVDAERFRTERDKRNSNRRKRRAAKKVAQGKPD